ncbi:hypothetical protein [Comamonas composti]|uniref:hypothetical protein n=1 Tax=Comamonas composti TaxID=408558 RepID=UPI000425DA42|nr:hypothetical protein [Comamonas composti]
MSEFLSVALGFPTMLFSIGLAVVLFYWLMAIIGLVDFGEGAIDLDIGDAADGSELGLIASYVVAFGLSGVPFSIVVTLLVVVAWTLSTLAGIWLLSWLPGLPLQLLGGLVVLVLSMALSVIITARLVRPLRGMFATQYGQSSADLVGQSCRILTGEVNERLGRAEVAQRGASLNIRVWSPSPNPLCRGSLALIVEYDAAAHRYLVQPCDD